MVRPGREPSGESQGPTTPDLSARGGEQPRTPPDRLSPRGDGDGGPNVDPVGARHAARRSKELQNRSPDLQGEGTEPVLIDGYTEPRTRWNSDLATAQIESYGEQLRAPWVTYSQLQPRLFGGRRRADVW